MRWRCDQLGHTFEVGTTGQNRSQLQRLRPRIHVELHYQATTEVLATDGVETNLMDVGIGLTTSWTADTQTNGYELYSRPLRWDSDWAFSRVGADDKDNQASSYLGGNHVAFFTPAHLTHFECLDHATSGIEALCDNFSYEMGARGQLSRCLGRRQPVFSSR